MFFLAKNFSIDESSINQRLYDVATCNWFPMENFGNTYLNGTTESKYFVKFL